ncbi:hypothetical protein L345_01295, partial [Ophiophagus hannah]
MPTIGYGNQPATSLLHMHTQQHTLTAQPEQTGMAYVGTGRIARLGRIETSGNECTAGAALFLLSCTSLPLPSGESPVGGGGRGWQGEGGEDGFMLVKMMVSAVMRQGSCPAKGERGGRGSLGTGSNFFFTLPPLPSGVNTKLPFSPALYGAILKSSKERTERSSCKSSSILDLKSANLEEETSTQLDFSITLASACEHFGFNCQKLIQYFKKNVEEICTNKDTMADFSIKFFYKSPNYILLNLVSTRYPGATLRVVVPEHLEEIGIEKTKLHTIL